MLTRQIALVAAPDAGVAMDDLAMTAAAIQKQVQRDFTPVWQIQAAVSVFAKIEDVPLGYWPLIVIADAPSTGVHMDHGGQPIALVAAGTSWSLAASHEALEMLADPSVMQVVAGFAPPPATGRVEFLFEVCDPCQGADQGYTVNGVLVSDFCTPNYFDPVASTGTRYSFTGAVSKPREILPGGYLSWHDPTSGHWFQAKRDSIQGVVIRDLGPIRPRAGSLRGAIDATTSATRPLSNVPPTHAKVSAASKARASAAAASKARAEEWRKLLRELKAIRANDA